ncbi:zinc finger protein chinmo-like isoform X2 [Pogonomyrmex barbatus]|uniref:Zinc finger protein chinmo-like isoform X2 n=1 Tax=Pogonomyrmex barbatus TaxID=144034 RepID=A0A6I9WHA6_9HYME|nr:zinc finger protein chinmo-like isoform X2 [Pogonomyrmex barbatus]
MAEKLAEKLSNREDEVYPGRGGFDADSYGPNSDRLPHGAQLGSSMVPIPPIPDPVALVMWNAKINKASTVSTIDGADSRLKCPFCERLYGFESNLRAHVRHRHQISPDAILLANVHQEQHRQAAGTQDRDEPESLP